MPNTARALLMAALEAYLAERGHTLVRAVDDGSKYRELRIPVADGGGLSHYQVSMAQLAKEAAEA